MGIEDFFGRFFGREKGEQEEKVRTVALNNVKMGSGSLEERLLPRKIKSQLYIGVNQYICQVPEFAVKETRPIVDILLLNFPEDQMTIADVKRWLASHSEYDEFELATPEHLDALNRDPRLARLAQKMSKKENKMLHIVAPGASYTDVAGNRWVVRMLLRSPYSKRDMDLSFADGRFSPPCWFALVRKAKKN